MNLGYGDEGWDSKVGEDAAHECAYSNAFNAIMEMNRSSKRACEGIIFNHDQWKGSKRRKWFEDVRLPGKLICVFISQVFNDEFDEDGDINRIALYAAFSIPNRIQSSFTLYATSTMKNVKRRNLEFNSSEIFATLKNMFQALPKKSCYIGRRRQH